MEIHHAKPRKRHPKKKKTTSAEAPVQTNLPALETNLQNEFLSLETRSQDDFPDNPAARRRLTSQHEQWSSKTVYGYCRTSEPVAEPTEL